MLGLSTKDTEEMIAVQDDVDVRVKHTRLVSARENLELLAVEERRLIKIVTGKDDTYSDEEFAEARHRLAIHKGTQTGWHLPEAETARAEVKGAEFSYQSAVIPARERLIAAATAKIVELTKRMNKELEPVRELAIAIQEIRDSMGEGGARPVEHTCPALLPGGVVDFQLRNARDRGWI